MSIIASFNGVHVEYAPADFARVKSTYDLHKMSRPTYNEWQKGLNVQSKTTGLPDVYRMLHRDPSNAAESVELDADKQHWLLKIQYDISRNKNHTKAEYQNWYNLRTAEVTWMINQLTSSMTSYRSHTNKMGMDNMRNYLTGENMDKGLPKWAKLLTGWACVKVIKEDGKPRIRPITVYGDCVEFEAINAKSDYWQYSPVTHRHLFDAPLTTARILNIPTTGAATIIRDDLHIPYGQFNNRLLFPLLMPDVSTAWIPVRQVSFSGWRDKIWIR
jgi:hypothetical protein